MANGIACYFAGTLLPLTRAFVVVHAGQRKTVLGQPGVEIVNFSSAHADPSAAG